ncbi:MAG: dihydrodipicolinate synthase family protein [Rhizobiales bacterium]|nr:dihydrodipicolinate synthase family protein [Hyphomicrobiales bacterium]
MRIFSAASRFGLSCAIATPFDPDGAIDQARLAAHAADLLARGCDGLTVFGTTGEGPSIGLDERKASFATLAAAGIPLATRVIAGVMASALPDALAQARSALDAGCRALLVAPPFFFKGVGDDGVFDWYGRFFEALAGRLGPVILYHIPQLTGVALSIELIQRLKTRYPEIIAGVKDSGGDWQHTEALLAAHAGDLDILVGDERHVAAALRSGGAGTICGLANLIPEAMRVVAHGGGERDEVGQLSALVGDHAFLPWLKTLLAHRAADPAWLALRPPLAGLSAEAAAGVVAGYDGHFRAKAA